MIDVKIFSRRIDDPLLEREHGERIAELRENEREEIGRVMEARDEEILELLQGETVVLCLGRGSLEPLFAEGTKLTKTKLRGIDLGEIDPRDAEGGDGEVERPDPPRGKPRLALAWNGSASVRKRASTRSSSPTNCLRAWFSS